MAFQSRVPTHLVVEDGDGIHTDVQSNMESGTHRMITPGWKFARSCHLTGSTGRVDAQMLRPRTFRKFQRPHDDWDDLGRRFNPEIRSRWSSHSSPRSRLWSKSAAKGVWVRNIMKARDEECIREASESCRLELLIVVIRDAYTCN